MKLKKLSTVSKSILLMLILCLSVMANENKMKVFQPPNGSCPKSWFTEMHKIVKDIEIITLMNVKPLKKDIGIPKKIQSCNTSFINDYIFEGNVPPQAIKDFFDNKPKNAIGLSLPAYENDKNPKTVYIIFKNKSYKKYGRY